MDVQLHALRVATDVAMMIYTQNTRGLTSMKPARDAYIAGAISYANILKENNNGGLLSPQRYSSELCRRVHDGYGSGRLTALQSTMIAALVHSDKGFIYSCWHEVRLSAGLLPIEDLHLPLVPREIYARETTIAETRTILLTWRNYLSNWSAHHPGAPMNPLVRNFLAANVSEAAQGFNRWADLITSHGRYPWEEDTAPTGNTTTTGAPARGRAGATGNTLSYQSRYSVQPPPLVRSQTRNRTSAAPAGPPHILEAAQVLVAMAQTDVQVATGTLPTAEEAAHILIAMSRSQVSSSNPVFPRATDSSAGNTQVPHAQTATGHSEVPSESAKDAAALSGPARGLKRRHPSTDGENDNGDDDDEEKGDEENNDDNAKSVERFFCDICPAHKGVSGAISHLRRHFRLTHDLPNKECIARCKRLYPNHYR